jgi:hypothetical protein
MSCVAASGCDTIEAWEAGTFWILAFARSASRQKSFVRLAYLTLNGPLGDRGRDSRRRPMHSVPTTDRV